jgi:beta-glucosidase
MRDSELEVTSSSIVSQLSLKEKLILLSGASTWSLSDALERFGLPAIRVSDGPHGLRKTLSDLSIESLPATCFPTAMAMASSWNPDLIQGVGKALAIEARHHNVSVVLGPAMNIQRHPCGGRNFEYFSEDPYLTGRLAAAMVQGIQQQGGVGACLKHICVNNQEKRRFQVDVIVDERTLREIYLRGFEYAVKQANPWTLMCAYNKLNGVYCSEQTWLFQQVIRGEWGFSGLVLTDWAATNDRVKGLQAGIDLEMPGSYGAHDSHIKEALDAKELTKECLDQAVSHTVDLIIKANKASENNADDLIVDAHHELAYRVALECAVLLKNQNEMLPLAKDTSLAMIGSFAKTPRIQGMGSSQVNPQYVENFWDCVSLHSQNVSFAPGYDPDSQGDCICGSLIKQAVETSQSASISIVLVGLPEICESEGFDREHMDLPAHHNALVEAVCAANPNTIVILSNGGSVTMPWVDRPKAIIEGFLLGEGGGRALADLVFGLVSPSGKLAVTSPIDLQDVPANSNFPGQLNQVEYREGLNIGYRFFCSSNVPILFPFGHGLSYSKFEYSNLTAVVEQDEKQEKKVTVQFELTNTGTIPAAEISQCYVHSCASSVYRPEIELKEFAKTHLLPGQTAHIKMILYTSSFAFYDVGVSAWVVEPQIFELLIGASCQDIRLKKSIQFHEGQKASRQAMESHPPRPVPYPLTVDDDTFREMLRQAPPPMQTLGLVDRNTLLQDVAKGSWLGYLISSIVASAMAWGLPIRENPKLRKVALAMRDELPLRGLVLFGQGRLSFATLDILISIMNGHYLHALRLCKQSLFSA